MNISLVNSKKDYSPKIGFVRQERGKFESEMT